MSLGDFLRIFAKTKENYYICIINRIINIIDKFMKKVLLSCIALAAGTAMAIAQEDPVYPSTLDFTLNGEKDLTGVSVNQTMGNESLLIEITGESDVDEITMDFVTPDGWDYALIGSVIGDEDNPFKTRSSHWLPVSLATQQGYKKGTSFSFPADGKKSYGTIYLVKGDNVWDTPIDIEFIVSKATGSGDTSLLEYPEHLDMTINGEASLPGITVSQELIPYDGDDYLTINVTGTYDADEITIDMTTPEGWDGMLTFTDYGEEEDEIEPLRVKVNMDEDSWVPLMFASWMGLTESNTLTFSVDGKEHQAMVYLVKEDNYYAVNIDFIFQVSKTDGSAVESINAIGGKAAYYDMNGNKIAKPDNGIYVKVANGKAAKVVVK